jgi:hypothetical protein
MHKVFLLSLAIVAAACGTPEPEPAVPAVTERDLTLPVPPSSSRAEVVRPAQVGRPIQQHPARRAHKPPHPAPVLLEPVIIPARYEPLPIIPIPFSTLGQSPLTTSEPADEHELLPGKTVMVIPSSSGIQELSPGGDTPPTVPSPD